MTPPKSLLQMAGASLAPSTFSNAALVVIDAQLEYRTGGLPLKGIDAAVAEIEVLLGLAREAGAPIFHVMHQGKAGGVLFDPEGPYFPIIPGLRPVATEAVVKKALPNSFAKTDLNDLIAKTGRKELIIAGFMTHLCVSATTRAALDLGYRSTVVASACATRDLPNPLGGLATAEMVHEGTLAALADRFAIVVPKAAALAA
jgi:nicotinamidase-related amidase